MVTWEIRKGYFLVHNEDGKQVPLFLGPYDTVNTFSFLPDMDDVYDDCQDKGLTQEQTIDVMLKIYHIRRFFRDGYLKDKELVE